MQVHFNGRVNQKFITKGIESVYFKKVFHALKTPAFPLYVDIESEKGNTGQAVVPCLHQIVG